MAVVHQRQGGQQDGEEVDHVQSAGEALITELVLKQTNTHVTLAQQLQDGRQFVAGAGLVALTELCPGVSSHQQLLAASQRAEGLADLQARGLSGAEAVSVLEEGGRRSKAAHHAQVARRDYIAQQLRPSVAEGDKCTAVSRHELEQAVSVKPGSVETRLYQFAMRNKPASATAEHPDHPIHQLAQLEHALVTTTPDPEATARTLLRKRKQLVQAMADPQLVRNKPPEGSLWDATEPPVVVPKKPHVVKTFSCKKPSLYTIKNGQIMQLDKTTENAVDETKSCKPSGQMFVSVEPTNQTFSTLKKLTEDEIKQLPKFQNYERGAVSKTLYIKNLSKNVSEEDLVAVFSPYQISESHKMIFRLMTGKMRGQAFVKFTSQEKATEALEELNGSILKGRPMVIQYGRQSDG